MVSVWLVEVCPLDSEGIPRDPNETEVRRDIYKKRGQQEKSPEMGLEIVRSRVLSIVTTNDGLSVVFSFF